MFVGMAQEVEGWAKDGYGGMTISPSADELQYEMNQLKQRFCVCSNTRSFYYTNYFYHTYSIGNKHPK